MAEPQVVWAPVLAVPITFIPVVGTVVNTAIFTVVALFGPWSPAR